MRKRRRQEQLSTRYEPNQHQCPKQDAGNQLDFADTTLERLRAFLDGERALRNRDKRSARKLY